jgi:hypothetical protein
LIFIRILNNNLDQAADRKKFREKDYYFKYKEVGYIEINCSFYARIGRVNIIKANSNKKSDKKKLFLGENSTLRKTSIRRIVLLLKQLLDKQVLQKPYKIIYNRFIIIVKIFLNTRARGFIFINKKFAI